MADLAATLVPGPDPFDPHRPLVGTGVVRALSDATVLASADVRTALVLRGLVGGTPDEVVLAAALAVRAVRLGHVFVDLRTIAGTAAPAHEELDVDVAGLDWPEPEAWIDTVAACPLVATGDDGPADRPLRLLASRLYLDRYWRHESSIAADLLGRSAASPPLVDEAVLDDGLGRLFPVRPDEPDLQRLAAETAVRRRFSVVAGGPGTGKTTTVARILALLHEQAAAAGQPAPRVALAAPTGKAAARLAEAVHHEAGGLDTALEVRRALLATPATTLHRLLGWQPGNRSRFRHDAGNQLGHTVVIVDECSMVGLSMMAKLLAAVRPSARLILVGDPRQLASVEAGAVLGDIVGPAADTPELTAPPGSVGAGVVVLRRIHRFSGGIVDLAHAIERGDPDGVLDVLRSGSDEVRWIDLDAGPAGSDAPELAGVRDAVVGAATAVIAAGRDGDARTALSVLRSVQVLCAHRHGPWGAARWRFEIERALRAVIPPHGASPWYAGRPLLVTENDHALGVFNGDTGVVVDDGDGRLRAVFDRRGELLDLRPSRLASVESLYAMTIHKAQGSQFGSVITVLPDASSPVLTRELLYTAVTRAQEHLTLVATEAMIGAAVSRPIARASGLAERLW